MIVRAVIFGVLEDAGRAATGGRQELTLREVYESYGGSRRGSRASQRLAEQLGVSQRQIQRTLTETAAERRRAGRKTLRFFRDLSTRELRLAGMRALRRRELQVAPGSTFALCYNKPPLLKQGRDREVRGDPVVISDQAWLRHFEAGAIAESRGDHGTAEREYDRMAEAFEAAFLDAYGGLGGGAFEICPEDGGQNLRFLI